MAHAPAPEPPTEVPADDPDAATGESTAARVGRTVVTGAATLLLVMVALWVLTAQGGHPREPSRRIKCSSNLRQIGLALKMYANGCPDSAYPPDLGAVLLTQGITSDVFVCPTAENDTRAEGPTTQTVAAALLEPNGHHCSYLYFGKGLLDDKIGEDDVLMIEPPANHDDAGCNVLFGDGHVDWYATGQAGSPGAAWYAQLLADADAGVRPLRIKP